MWNDYRERYHLRGKVLSLSRAYDLWQAQKSYRQEIEKIKPLCAA